MNSPASLLPLLVSEDGAAPSFVDRTYGEPLFHTDSEAAALAFAADGTLWTVEEAGLLRQWGLDGRLLQRHFLSDLEDCWTFGPGALKLVSGTTDVALWDVPTGRLKARRPAGDAWVTGFAVSPDGTMLASGHDDGTVRLWEVAGLKPVGEPFAAHAQAVSALAFTPDGAGLTTAGDDHRIRLWDVATRTQKQEWAGHADRVPALAWTPSGEFFLTAGWDTTARVWEPGRPDPLMLLNAHSDQVTTLAVGPDGSVACGDSDFAVHVWSDPRRGKARHVLRGHSDELRALAFSQDGKRLASAGADRVVHVWDAEAGKLVAGPNPHHKHAIAVAGPLFLSTAGGGLTAFDAATGEAAWSPADAGPVAAVAASADGSRAVTSGPTPDAIVWDLRARAKVQTLNHTRGPIGSPAFSKDGTRVATASQSDGLVWVWTVGRPEADLVIPEAADASTLEAVAFHPSGKYIAVGGIDFLATSGTEGSLCVWDLDAKDKHATFTAGVTAVAFDAAGKYLAAGVYKPTGHAVVVWDFAGQKKVFDLPGHQDRVTAVAFSPDGSYLASGSDDCTVRVWDVLSGRLAVVRQFDAAVQSLAFSADGSALHAGLGNATAVRADVRKLLED